MIKIAELHIERVIQQSFSTVRLDVQHKDRFGERVAPREWFLIPLPVIRVLVKVLTDGRIEHCVYDAESAWSIGTRSGAPIE